MADLTPAELAKLDQIHANIMGKVAELISRASDGIDTEGEEVTASKLAAEAAATDHLSISTLLAATLIRAARAEKALGRRGNLTRTEDGYESEHYTADGTLDQAFSYCGSPERMAEHAIDATTRHHNDPAYADDPYVYSRVIRYTDRTFRTVEEVVYEMGTKPGAPDGPH